MPDGDAQQLQAETTNSTSFARLIALDNVTPGDFNAPPSPTPQIPVILRGK